MPRQEDKVNSSPARFADSSFEKEFELQDTGVSERENERLKWGSFADSDWHRAENIASHFGKGPKGWTRSDEKIREDACEALYCDFHVDASNIDVSVKDGCIFLRGTVESREVKKHAENCVEKISGIIDVHNELRIIKS